jgi:hypothetical protein
LAEGRVNDEADGVYETRGRGQCEDMGEKMEQIGGCESWTIVEGKGEQARGEASESNIVGEIRRRRVGIDYRTEADD